MTFKTVIVYYHYDVYVVCVDVIDSYRRTSVTSHASRGELNELQQLIQESPAVAEKPARRLRKVCTVYVRAVGL